ncbi:MAG: hypothetical protein ACRCXZ_06590 [Patescibacteria group bacterium]
MDKISSKERVAILFQNYDLIIKKITMCFIAIDFFVINSCYKKELQHAQKIPSHFPKSMIR